MTNFSIEFILKGNRIEVTVPTIESSSDILIKTDEFRFFPSLLNPTRSDWYQDTKYLFDQLSALPLEGLEDYKLAFLKLCTKHITEYKRLVDSNLFTYIDEILIVIKHLAKLEGAALRREDGQKVWQTFKEAAFLALTPYIWVNVPTKLPSQPFKLVQLVDFNAGNY